MQRDSLLLHNKSHADNVVTCPKQSCRHWLVGNKASFQQKTETRGEKVMQWEHRPEFQKKRNKRQREAKKVFSTSIYAMCKTAFLKHTTY